MRPEWCVRHSRVPDRPAYSGGSLRSSPATHRASTPASCFALETSGEWHKGQREYRQRRWFGDCRGPIDGDAEQGVVQRQVDLVRVVAGQRERRLAEVVGCGTVRENSPAEPLEQSNWIGSLSGSSPLSFGTTSKARPAPGLASNFVVNSRISKTAPSTRRIVTDALAGLGPAVTYWACRPVGQVTLTGRPMIVPVPPVNK